MRKITITQLEDMKQRGEKITMLTAYDASFAHLASSNGTDSLLIGDSLGNVILGHDSTVPVTMDDMLHHTAAVARGNQGSFLIADLPYMSYATREQTLGNAARLMQAGAHMVKLEGGAWLSETVAALSERGVPVCAHVGLTPQSVDALGGYKVQGREPEAAARMIHDVRALALAGARLVVLECVPALLAARITREIPVISIGIGAGVETDGQVLVSHDMLGLTPGKRPKFSKDFLAGCTTGIAGAVTAFNAAVKGKQFPADEHSFS